MRIRIRHETIYRYEEPAKSAIQHLRLTPRNYDGQHVKDWRIDIDHDCRLIASEDAFGNMTHRFTVEGPLDSITTLVEGDVTTFDTAGVASGAIERFPQALYLRPTPLTAPSAEIVDFARATTARETNALASLHALLSTIYEQMTFDTDSTHAATTAAESFAQRRGICQDFAHLFIACARAIDTPARYVSGYYLRSDGDQQVRHMPGRRRWCRTSAGSASIRPMPPARPTATCAWRPDSMRWASPPSAARAGAETPSG